MRGKSAKPYVAFYVVHVQLNFILLAFAAVAPTNTHTQTHKY